MRLLLGYVLVLPIAIVGLVNGAKTATVRLAEGTLDFHYGVLQPSVVLWRLDSAAHTPPTSGERHLAVAVFDRDTRTRATAAAVPVTMERGRGGAVTRRLDPMRGVNQPSSGGFFRLSAPGVHKTRWEARRPGAATIHAGEFECRVSPKVCGR
jgi:hypothetical protein